MGRKTLWRTFTMKSAWEAQQIESAFASSREALGKDKVLTISRNEIETNISLPNLNALFRHADLPMPDCVTDTLCLDDRVKEWEKEEKER